MEEVPLEVVVPVRLSLLRVELADELREVVVPVLLLLLRDELADVLREFVEPVLLLLLRELLAEELRELLSLRDVVPVLLLLLLLRELLAEELRELLSLRVVVPVLLLLLRELPVALLRLDELLVAVLLLLREELAAELRLDELLLRDWVTSGACEVERLPVRRSVVVTVLLLRLLVIRFPLRDVGSFCTITFERLAVILPVVLVGMYS